MVSDNKEGTANDALFCTCPECHVMYQLNHALLKRGKGLVKCGVCRHIFEAGPLLMVEENGRYVPLSSTKPQTPDSAEPYPENRTFLPENQTTDIHKTSSGGKIDSAMGDESEWIDSEATLLDSITMVQSEFGENWEELPLFAAISSYVHGHKTGTAMIVFSDNSMGRILLENGVPVSARYRVAEGKDVFRICGNFQVLTVKFHANQDLVHSTKGLESILH